MATSKNRRKNGKRCKNDTAKRMRQMAAYDLKDLMVCNVVDRNELCSGEGSEMIPRTLVYNRRLKAITPITRLQECALKTERWFWNIQFGIVCRKQNGEVYFDKETNVQLGTEVLLTEMNDYVVDKLMDLWNRVNPLHALTMYWVACPYDIDKRGIEYLPIEAILAPLWKFNVLGNMLTRYEQDNPNLQVLHYKANTLDDFFGWYISQEKYRNEIQ